MEEWFDHTEVQWISYFANWTGKELSAQEG